MCVCLHGYGSLLSTEKFFRNYEKIPKNLNGLANTYVLPRLRATQRKGRYNSGKWAVKSLKVVF